MQSMQENATLVDSLTTLTRQLENQDDQRRREKETSDARVAELLRRVNASEKQLAVLGSQGGVQATLDETLRKLGAKEEMVVQLLSEGERLSKAELKLNTTIKRLRAEKVEVERERKEDATRFEKMQNEAGDLKAALAEATDRERKHVEASKALTESNDRQQKEIKRLQGELVTVRDSLAKATTELESTRSDLQESKRGASESAVHSESLLQAQREAEQARTDLSSTVREAESVQSHLQSELQSLRATLAQREDEAGWKEDAWNRETSTLRARLQESEQTNRELANVGDESARPLLRQIETLQSQHASAVRKWETVERQLTTRLRDVEAERTRTADASERHADEIEDLKLQLASCRSELERCRSEVETTVETVKSRDEAIARLESTSRLAASRVAQLEGDHRMVLELSNQTEERLRRELEEERKRWTDHRRGSAGSRSSLGDAVPVTEKEEEKVVVPVPVVPMAPSPTPLQVDVHAKRGMGSKESRRSSSALGSPMSSEVRFERDPFSMSGAGLNTGAMVERLHTTIRHYEGQLGSLRLQLSMAEQGR
ncbi:hypothetical protein HKX48_002767, partial [Thoreauomyces humboldtii]